MSWTGRCGVVLLALCLVIGACTVFKTEKPTDDRIILCSAMLVNPTARLDEGVTDFPQSFAASNAVPFMFMEMNVAEICSVGSNQGFASIADAEASWREFVFAKLEILKGVNGSIFNTDDDDGNGGMWCENPAMPVVCEAIERKPNAGFCGTMEFPIDFPPDTVGTLAPCPGLIPSPPRVVTCRDDVDPCDRSALCGRIDFAEVSVGDSLSETIRVANCSTDQESTVQFDGLVSDPESVDRRDFFLNDTGEPDSCRPVAGEEFVTLGPGEECTATVTFRPAERGFHSGDMGITGTQYDNIELRGSAPGGALVAQVDGEICVDELLASGCTEVRSVELANGGNGLMTLDAMRFEQTTGFEFVDPPTLPVDLSPGAVPLIVNFNWCPAEPADQNTREDGWLIFEFEDPQDPPLSAAVRREPAGCNPLAPLAAYNFEVEVSDDVVADVTGNGFDGAIVSPAAHSVDGKFGGSMEFTGEGGHVILNPNLEVTGASMTIALWFRADDFEVTDARFIARGTGLPSATQGWLVGTGDNAINLRFRLRTTLDGTTSLATAGVVQDVGVWTHVAVTYDGALMTLYKDGDFVVSEVKNGAIDNIAEAAIWIGDNPPGGERSFDGLIDEVRIYDRALSEQEIQQIMISPL